MSTSIGLLLALPLSLQQIALENRTERTFIGKEDIVEIAAITSKHSSLTEFVDILLGTLAQNERCMCSILRHNIVKTALLHSQRTLVAFLVTFSTRDISFILNDSQIFSQSLPAKEMYL